MAEPYSITTLEDSDKSVAQRMRRNSTLMVPPFVGKQKFIKIEIGRNDGCAIRRRGGCGMAQARIRGRRRRSVDVPADVRSVLDAHFGGTDIF
jgi:hypothetical protein